jgi:hypothetical protein
MKWFLSIVVCLSILAAPYAALANPQGACPRSVTCSIDQQQMYKTGQAKVVEGHRFWLYAHDVVVGGKTVHHEQWVQCDYT